MTLEEQKAMDKSRADAKAAEAKARKDAAEHAVKESDERKAAIVAEFDDRTRDSKPTPTPAEVDAAKVGNPPAELEDDGSGEYRAPGVSRQAAADANRAGYQTRTARPVPPAPVKSDEKK